MPAGHSWNLTEWMSALGIRRKEQPEVVYAVQPVELMGDHSAFTAPLLAPTAWVGGARTPAAGSHACCQLTSRAPGGTFVRLFSVSSVVARLNWAISLAPPTLNNSVAGLVTIDMAPDPVVSLWDVGDILAAALPHTTAQGPEMRQTANLNQWLVEPFYVRPGYTLSVWCGTAATATNFSCLFEDNPAQRGAP